MRPRRPRAGEGAREAPPGFEAPHVGEVEAEGEEVMIRPCVAALSPIHRYQVPFDEMMRVRAAHARLFGSPLPSETPYRPDPAHKIAPGFSRRFDSQEVR